ncbi:beta-lactamase family protein [Nostoc sp. CHAB 5715]|nr:beta-lactamase family protein [Nostoc sp. CHAB 5715]
MKKAIQLLLLAPALLLGSCEKEPEASPAQSNCDLGIKNHPNAAKYQKIIDKFMRAGAAGVSITIKSPEGVWTAASGKADLPGNVNLSPCHTLRIGSISKTFTSAVILKLQEEGKLNINDLACKYLPEEYTRNIRNLEKATIRDLLQHTSGVHEYLGIGGLLDILNLSVRRQSAEENLRSIFGKKARFEVGKAAQYTNSNYLILALVIKNVTKKTAYEAVTDMIIN